MRQRPGWQQRTRSWWEKRILRRRTQAAYDQGLRDGSAAQQDSAVFVQRRATPFIAAALLALIVVLLCFLLASLMGWKPGGWFVSVEPTQVISISSDELLSGTAQVAALPPPQVQGVDARFQPSYDQAGGERVLGYAISPVVLMQIGGQQREVQWFQRGRLEHWPELAGQGYEYQLGRVGVEYTTDIRFPAPPPAAVQPQPYVVSTPDRIYFRETQHTLGGGFLRFWQANGDLRAFGFPISEEFNEVLDGRSYRVQYFERGRLEWHPDLAPPNDIQAGLLGSALYAAAGYQPVGTRPVSGSTAVVATPPPGATATLVGQPAVQPSRPPAAQPTAALPVAPTIPPPGYPASQNAAPQPGRSYP